MDVDVPDGLVVVMTDGRGEADERLKLWPNRSEAEIVWCFILLNGSLGFGLGFEENEAEFERGCFADFGWVPGLVGECALDVDVCGRADVLPPALGLRENGFMAKEMRADGQGKRKEGCVSSKQAAARGDSAGQRRPSKNV